MPRIPPGGLHRALLENLPRVLQAIRPPPPIIHRLEPGRVRRSAVLYGYQVRIARAVLHALFVELKDVYVKQSRQSGKMEGITLPI